MKIPLGEGASALSASAFSLGRPSRGGRWLADTRDSSAELYRRRMVGSEHPLTDCHSAVIPCVLFSLRTPALDDQRQYGSTLSPNSLRVCRIFAWAGPPAWAWRRRRST